VVGGTTHAANALEFLRTGNVGLTSDYKKLAILDFLDKIVW
jgi:hypothetical protein